MTTLITIWRKQQSRQTNSWKKLAQYHEIAVVIAIIVFIHKWICIRPLFGWVALNWHVKAIIQLNIPLRPRTSRVFVDVACFWQHHIQPKPPNPQSCPLSGAQNTHRTRPTKTRTPRRLPWSSRRSAPGHPLRIWIRWQLWRWPPTGTRRSGTSWRWLDSDDVFAGIMCIGNWWMGIHFFDVLIVPSLAYKTASTLKLTVVWCWFDALCLWRRVSSLRRVCVCEDALLLVTLCVAIPLDVFICTLLAGVLYTLCNINNPSECVCMSVAVHWHIDDDICGKLSVCQMYVAERCPFRGRLPLDEPNQRKCMRCQTLWKMFCSVAVFIPFYFKLNICWLSLLETIKLCRAPNI